MTEPSGIEPTPIEIQDVQRLVVHPGDRLLVTMPPHATTEECHQVGLEFRRVFPGVPVAICCDGITVTVVVDDPRDVNERMRKFLRVNGYTVGRI